MREVSFLRSPAAHALITSQSKPQGYEDSVFFHSDLAGVAARVASKAPASYGKEIKKWLTDRAPGPRRAHKIDCP